MTTQALIEQKLQELRKLYKEQPSNRRIILCRARALEIALEKTGKKSKLEQQVIESVM